MATVCFPPFRHLGGGLRRSTKPAPWLSPFRLPHSRRGSEVRYPSPSKLKGMTKSAPKIPVTTTTLYVDASGIGIGMKLGREGAHWQRWAFNGAAGTIHRSPKTKEIDAQWAELLAVYAGLQTLVTGGVCASLVTLYSDNSVVVDTLHRLALADVHPSLWGTVQKPHRDLSDLLKRIGEVCEKHGLKIAAQWVPTGENPADSPSRGKNLVEGYRLPYGRDLPDDLGGALVGI